MAQRRMFSPDIVASDAFLEMPTSSRELYFQLGMYADDDGFVNPKKIMRMIGASEDDLRVLLIKRFLLPFESGVVVVKHWLIHNLIRKDRYRETRYLEEKKTLRIKQNNAYTEMPTSGRPDAAEMTTQYRVVKGSIVKTAEQSSDSLKKIEEPFVYEKYLETMRGDSRKHIRLISYFFKRKGLVFNSKKEVQAAIGGRNVKSAQKIVDAFPNDKIEKAIDLCVEKHSDIDWGLETVFKKLTNSVL